MKLIHISMWFGVEDEPIEYAWFDEDLDWFTERSFKSELKSIYDDEALKLEVL